VGVVLVLYAALYYLLWPDLAKIRSLFRPSENKRITIEILLTFAGAAACFAVVAAKAYPGLYVEEIFVIRKIVELDPIQGGMLSLLPGEHTTYLLFPLPFLIGLISHYTGIEVLAVQRAMWPGVSVISLLVLAKTCVMLCQRRRAGLLVWGMAMASALTVPAQMSAVVTLFHPTVDRYGLVIGLLVPLVFFHFLIFVKERRTHVGLFVGLVYLVMELTFVHAKEALYVLSFIAVYGACAAILKDRAGLARSLIVAAICSGSLFVYLLINQWVSPWLLDFMFHTRAAMGELFVQNTDRMYHVFSLEEASAPYNMYRNFWQTVDKIPGYQFAGWSVALLGLFAWRCRRAEEFAVAMLAGVLGLVMYMDRLKLGIGSILGNWHVFDMNSFIILLCLFVFVSLLAGGNGPGKAIVAFGAAGVALFVLLPEGMRIITDHLDKYGGRHILTNAEELFGSGPILGIVKQGYYGLRSFYLLYMDLRVDWLFVFSAAFGVGLGLAFARLVFLRIYSGAKQWSRPGVGNDQRNSIPGRHPAWCFALRAGGLMLAGLVGLGGVSDAGVREKGIWGDRDLFGGRRCEELGHRSEVASCLVESSYFFVLSRRDRVTASSDLVHFIRHESNPLTVWVGSDTLVVPLVAPEYVAMVAWNDVMVGNFLGNDRFLTEIARDNTGLEMSQNYRVGVDDWVRNDSSTLGRLIERYSRVYIIVGVGPYKKVKSSMQTSRMRGLEVLFDNGREMVLSATALGSR
jgi:hypothetical protein